jgi:hypothetical protein
MEKYQIIKDILLIPTTFFADKNSSVYSLLKKSGYFDLYHEIQEIDLLKALIEYPECIENWLLLSENKRTISGWYFKHNEVDKHIVGYFPVKEHLKLTEYADIKEACAAFIKYEIEDIRMS